MNKKIKMDLYVQDTLNRGIIYTVFMKSNSINFVICHHKQTPGLQFQVDSNNPLIKNKSVFIKMYRNLDNCDFCNLFFNMKTEETEETDYRAKFMNVKNHMSKYVIGFMREKLDLKCEETKGSYQNYITVSGWKIHGIEDDLVFFDVERRCYNNVTRTNVVRSAGIQFSTKKGLDALDKYLENQSSMVRKVQDGDDVPNFFCDADFNLDTYDEDDETF